MLNVNAARASSTLLAFALTLACACNKSSSSTPPLDDGTWSACLDRSELRLTHRAHHGPNEHVVRVTLPVPPPPWPGGVAVHGTGSDILTEPEGRVSMGDDVDANVKGTATHVEVTLAGKDALRDKLKDDPALHRFVVDVAAHCD